MKTVIYENHIHQDPEFPIIFHKDTTDGSCELVIHYHENIEILYFTEGSGKVRYGNEDIEAKKGDMIVISPNELHLVHDLDEACTYYCLIIDQVLSKALGIETKKHVYQTLVHNEQLGKHMQMINEEMNNCRPYFKEKVKLLALDLLVTLTRDYAIQPLTKVHEVSDGKIETIKQIIDYIKNNFTQPISVDELAEYIGLSKYYLCRLFKDMTNQTILEYVNYMRCDYARKLLHSGKYNVTEAAEASGFNNMSYFSKTYQKYMGKRPSEESVKAR